MHRRSPPLTSAVLLAERTAAERISGGYRYNDGLAAALRRRGTGGLVRLDTAGALLDLCAQTLIIDSLWLQSPAPAALRSDLVLLGHYFPPDNPFLSPQAKRGWLRSAGTWLARSRSVVVTGSATRESWQRHFPEPVPTVVPPAVVTRRRSGGPGHGPLQLLTMGSVSAAKLPLPLLEEMARLARYEFEWRIAGPLSGDPDHLRDCRACLAAVGLGDRVQFVGPLSVEEVQVALWNADVYLATSQFESFGMASAEALAAGVPLIGFAAGELRSWLPHDEACTLVPVGDYRAFVTHVADWLTRTRQQLPEPGTPRLPMTDWDAVADRLVAAIA